MKAKLFFRWYDLWVGAYWDSSSRSLYVCPLPMVGVKLTFSRKINPVGESCNGCWENANYPQDQCRMPHTCGMHADTYGYAPSEDEP